MKKIFAVCTLLALSLPLARAQTNLLRGGKFTPVKMDGEETAAYGWNLVDYGRMTNNWWNPEKKKYLSGRDCFKLSFSENTLSMEFLTTAPEDYFSQKLYLYNTSGRMPAPAAPEYRMTGQVKLDMGKLIIAKTKACSPADQWQEINLTISEELYKTTRGHTIFTITPAPGMKISFRDFKLEALYPSVPGAAVHLPHNGKLQQFIIPENASFDLKYLAECWKSWVWRLTGIALPIVEGNTDMTLPNAFVFRKGIPLREDGN